MRLRIQFVSGGVVIRATGLLCVRHREPSNISFMKCPSVFSSTLTAKGYDDGAH
jgi:hypothetical protein